MQWRGQKVVFSFPRGEKNCGNIQLLTLWRRRRLGHDLAAIAAATPAPIGAEAALVLRCRGLEVRTLLHHHRHHHLGLHGGGGEGRQVGHVHVDGLRHH